MPGQINRKKRIRNYLDDTLKDTKPGTILFTDELSSALCLQHHGESNLAIGLALRERSDVKNIRDGVWMKL